MYVVIASRSFQLMHLQEPVGRRVFLQLVLIYTPYRMIITNKQHMILAMTIPELITSEPPPPPLESPWHDAKTSYQQFCLESLLNCHCLVTLRFPLRPVVPMETLFEGPACIHKKEALNSSTHKSIHCRTGKQDVSVWLFGLYFRVCYLLVKFLSY